MTEKRILIILASFVMVQASLSTRCRQEDYLAVIGGLDYTVNTINAEQVMVDGTFYIAVAGKYTLNKNSVSSAFFYLLDGGNPDATTPPNPQQCQVTIQKTFEDIQAGFQAVTFNTAKRNVISIAMVGYGTDVSPFETLVIVNIIASDVYYNQFLTSAGYQDFVLPKGLLTKEQDVYFIVGKKEIRKFRVAVTTLSKIVMGQDIFTHASLDINTLNTIGVQADQIVKSSWSTSMSSVSAQSMSFPGFTYSTVNARIHTVTDSSFCAHQATGKVFFVWQWLDVTQTPKQFFISQWMQCLDAKIVSSQKVNFLMMTETLDITVVIVNFSTPQVSTYTGLSDTITGWQGFSAANLSNYSVGTNMIAGLTNQIYNSQASYNVGFVRLFPVVSSSGAVITFTQDTVTATNVDYTGNSPTPESQATQITLNGYLSNSKLTVIKNQWINQFCAEIPLLKVKNSTCVFWEIFKVKILESQLDFSNQYVPKLNISCPIEDTFDVSPLMTSIAKVCYPSVILPDDSKIPSEKVTGDKLLNKVECIYSWPLSLNPKLMNNEYLSQVKASSDCLQESIFWFNFVSQKAKNTIVSITKGKPFNFLAWNTWDKFDKLATIMCWSLYCPTFVKFDQPSGKFFASADDLCFKKTNKYVIIYQIDVFYSAQPNKYTGYHNYTTVTVNVDCGAPIINITKPFDQYYKQFKNKIPYKMFPPAPSTKAKFQTQYIEPKKNSDSKSSTSTLNETDSWTDQDWATAYAEAEVRVTQLSTVVVVKTSMNNMGLFQINFNSDVFIPWYMLFNHTSDSQSNSTNSSSLQNRRLNSKQEKRNKPANKNSEKCSWWVLLLYRYLQDDPTADPAVDDSSVFSPTADDPSDAADDPSEAPADDPDDVPADGEEADYGADVEPVAPVIPADDSNADVQSVAEDNSAMINVSIRDGVEVVACELGFYFNTILKTCVPLQVYFGKLKDLITLKLISPDDTAMRKDFTWKIQSVSKRQVSIQLDFQQPLEIQTTDKIKLGLNFQQFEESMLPELPYSVNCIKQLPKGDGSKQLQQVVEQASVAVISTLVISVVMQTLMVGAMAQIWGMISGIQFMIWLPLIQISLPANVQLVTQSILMVATFDIPKFNMADIFGDYWDLGEDGQILNIDNTTDQHAILLWNNLDQLGMSSRYASETFGSVFIIILCSFFILALTEFLFWWRKIIKLKRLLLMLRKKFLWNYFIRQQYQMTMEICICCYFNVYYGRIWGIADDHAEQQPVTLAMVINYLFSCILFFCMLVQPIAILVFYFGNYKLLSETKFRNKWGTVYEGYKPEQNSAVLMPFFYTIRRILLGVIIIYFSDFAWMQFFIMIYSTLFTACYILHTQPCAYRGYLEVMNEVTLLFLINLSLNFTDLVLNQETQYTAGWLYIVVFCGTIAVHLSLIILDGMRDLVKKVKKRCMKKGKNKIGHKEEQVQYYRVGGQGKLGWLKNAVTRIFAATPSKNNKQITTKKKKTRNSKPQFTKLKPKEIQLAAQATILELSDVSSSVLEQMPNYEWNSSQLLSMSKAEFQKVDQWATSMLQKSNIYFQREKKIDLEGATKDTLPVQEMPLLEISFENLSNFQTANLGINENIDQRQQQLIEEEAIIGEAHIQQMTEEEDILQEAGLAEVPAPTQVKVQRDYEKAKYRVEEYKKIWLRDEADRILKEKESRKNILTRQMQSFLRE